MPLMRTPSARMGRCAGYCHSLLLLHEGWRTNDICMVAWIEILSCQTLGKPITDAMHEVCLCAGPLSTSRASHPVPHSSAPILLTPYSPGAPQLL